MRLEVPNDSCRSDFGILVLVHGAIGRCLRAPNWEDGFRSLVSTALSRPPRPLVGRPLTPVSVRRGRAAHVAALRGGRLQLLMSRFHNDSKPFAACRKRGLYRQQSGSETIVRGPALAGAVIHQLAVQQHMRVLILRLYDDRCASRHVARRIKHLLMFNAKQGAAMNAPYKPDHEHEDRQSRRLLDVFIRGGLR